MASILYGKYFGKPCFAALAQRNCGKPFDNIPHRNGVRKMITMTVVRKLIHLKMNGKYSLQSRKAQLGCKLSCRFKNSYTLLLPHNSCKDKYDHFSICNWHDELRIFRQLSGFAVEPLGWTNLPRLLRS